MQQHATVAVVPYRTPQDSVRRAVELAGGLGAFTPGTRVFIKPNIVFWTRAVPFPKYGVITTTRVVEDMLVLLKEQGVHDITIGEGTVTLAPKDTATPADAFERLGYTHFKRKYGVRLLNIFERPFDSVDLGEDIRLNFNRDVLACDRIVDLPVLKTHNLTTVSLGIKNLKGLIDIPSRKRCHSADPHKDLHFHVARLADRLPPVFTLIDGIYSLERGPGFDGRAHRSDLLIAAADTFAADKVGARLLGHAPAQVPHLVHYAANHGRPSDLSDLTVVGTAVDGAARPHACGFPWDDSDGEALPQALKKMGLRGLSYPKYDLSICTYCSFVNGLILSAIRFAWKGTPWDDVEILTGKTMQPTPGRKQTILLGKCMYQAHRHNPDIATLIAVKGCPPKMADIVAALHRAGIAVDPQLFENVDQLPGFFLPRYQGRPEFDDAFFQAAD